jgi:hypothetical protein
MAGRGAELNRVDGVDAIEATALDLLADLDEELALPDVWAVVPL